jgi:hypothetical protein
MLLACRLNLAEVAHTKKKRLSRPGMYHVSLMIYLCVNDELNGNRIMKTWR